MASMSTKRVAYQGHVTDTPLKIQPERDYSSLFTDPKCAPFFPRRIRNRGWGGLFYTPETSFQPQSVVDFYNAMTRHPDNSATVFGTPFTSASLADALGIPLAPLSDHMESSMSFSDLLASVTLEGRMTSKPYLAALSSFRPNQMAVIYWLADNVMPNSKASDVPPKWLYFLRTLQIPNTTHYCIITAMWRAITDRRRQAAILPVAITRWMEHHGLDAPGERVVLETKPTPREITFSPLGPWLRHAEERREDEQMRQGYPVGQPDPLDPAQVQSLRTQSEHTAAIFRGLQHIRQSNVAYTDYRMRLLEQRLGVPLDEDEDDEAGGQ